MHSFTFFNQTFSVSIFRVKNHKNIFLQFFSDLINFQSEHRLFLVNKNGKKGKKKSKEM